MKNKNLVIIGLVLFALYAANQGLGFWVVGLNGLSSSCKALRSGSPVSDPAMATVYANNYCLVEGSGTYKCGSANAATTNCQIYQGTTTEVAFTNTVARNADINLPTGKCTAIVEWQCGGTVTTPVVTPTPAPSTKDPDRCSYPGVDEGNKKCYSTSSGIKYIAQCDYITDSLGRHLAWQPYQYCRADQVCFVDYSATSVTGFGCTVPGATPAPIDSTICPTNGAYRCKTDTLMQYCSQGSWRNYMTCDANHICSTDPLTCLEPCSTGILSSIKSGQATCSGDDLGICQNGMWNIQDCPYGCANNACKDNPNPTATPTPASTTPTPTPGAQSTCPTQAQVCSGQCGSWTNCGNTYDCGACKSTCIPTTCVAQGKNCGTMADGCTGTLNCGSWDITTQMCVGNVKQDITPIPTDAPTYTQAPGSTPTPTPSPTPNPVGFDTTPLVILAVVLIAAYIFYTRKKR